MNRKAVLEILREHFNEKPKYLGAPTFAYEITTGSETYTIDKVGSITNTLGQEVILKDLLEPEEAVGSLLEETIDAEPTVDQAEVTIPLGDHTVYTLRNLINMIASNLTVSFPHSNGGYTQLFKSENQECLLEGLKSIFEHMGGTPTEIWFDNASTIVKAIRRDGERDLNQGFERLRLTGLTVNKIYRA